MNQRHSSILSLWLVPGLVGLLLRLTGAWSGMGPFAADDYTFGIEWGYTWFLDSEASFDSAFRSPLMGQFIAGAMTLGHFLGFRDPIVLLQFAYCLLGVASVGCIPAAYTLASEKFDAQHGKAAAWLVAVFPLMPRITTRGLIGVVAMLPILWGFVWLERSLKSRDKVSIKAGAAAVLVGLGALVRYQVGILYVAVLVALVVRRFYGDKKDVFREALLGWFAGGLVVVVLQSFVDWSVGRAPLEAIVNYLAHNVSNSSNYGTSPWWTYVLHFAVYAFGPLAFLMAKSFWKTMRSWFWLSVPFGSFVLIHSLVPHKEERFMFPVLGLFLVLLAPSLVQLWNDGGWRRRCVGCVASLSLVGALGAATSDSLSARTIPLVQVARTLEHSTMAVVGIKHIPSFYSLGRIELKQWKSELDFLSAYSGKQGLPDFVLIREDKMQIAGGLEELKQCDGPRHYTGDWVDQLACRFNPKRNKRRLSNYFWDCRSPKERADKPIGA